MNVQQYAKDQIPVILTHLLGILALILFLTALQTSLYGIVLIVCVWMTGMLSYLIILFLIRKRHLHQLLSLANQLEDKYLFPEVMPIPKKADEQVMYRIFKMSEKSMLEKIDQVQQERTAYKEYIESWIHEIKTPITAAKLICENAQDTDTRKVLAEIEKIDRLTEQALFYARCEHTEKDYMIRETLLSDVIHGAIADNKYLLRQYQTTIEFENIDQYVYTDGKWVRFILNQLIGNAIKYRSNTPLLHFYCQKAGHTQILFVSDNGIGITGSDLPRIFEKGFTGKNGRITCGASGIGLYLSKQLCDKLGIGLNVSSNNGGTTFSLTFPLNDFISDVQGH